MLEEQRQQVELGARQLDPAVAAVHLVRDRVEHEVAEPQRPAPPGSARRSSARRRAFSSFSANGLTR